jgi:PAS domain S-box-containing protein
MSSSKTANIPVIIFTGKGTDTHAATVLKAGAYEYLTKSEETFTKLPAIAEQVYAEWKHKQAAVEAERELQETQKKLDKMLTTMVDGMVVVDTDGQIVYANPGATEILELKKDEIVGKYYQDRVWHQIDEDGNPYPQDRLPLAIALSELREAKEIEHGIVATNGDKKWLSVNAAPLFDDRNRLSGAVASFRDITQKKKMEKELEKSLSFHLKLFDQLPNPKLRTDRRGRCNYVNLAWIEFTGKHKNSQMEDGWKTNLHPEDYHLFEEKFYNAFVDRRRIDIECRIKNGEGEYRWCVLIARPFYDLDDAFAGYLVTINDITERKRQENYQREEFLRELSLLEPLSSRTQTTVTAQSFGQIPIKAKLPLVFEQLVERFCSILDKQMEQRTYKVEYDVSKELKETGEELGRLKAGPRDVIDIYTTALKKKSESTIIKKSQVYAEEGRLMALELMGYLVTFYRNYYFSSVKVNR